MNVMSLIVHLIPMLLLTAKFLTLSQVTGKGPVLPSEPAPSQAQLASQDQKVVSVRITAAGFIVGGTGAADPRIPCIGECTLELFDYASLNRAMTSAKRLHPTETRVVIVPEPSISYDILIRVMDATRSVIGNDKAVLFPDPLLASGAP